MRKFLKAAPRWRQAVEDEWVQTFAPDISVDIKAQLADVEIF